MLTALNLKRCHHYLFQKSDVVTQLCLPTSEGCTVPVCPNLFGHTNKCVVPPMLSVPNQTQYTQKRSYWQSGFTGAHWIHLYAIPCAMHLHVTTRT